MTDEELDAIEARSNAATASPWCWDTAADGYGLNLYDADGEAVMNEYTNRQFVEAARDDVPALVAELRDARTQLAVAYDNTACYGALVEVKAERVELRTQLAALKPNHGCRVCAWDAGVQGGQSGGYCSGHADEAEAELDALLAQRQAALDIDWAAEVDFYNGSAHYMDVEKVLARVLEGKP